MSRLTWFLAAVLLLITDPSIAQTNTEAGPIDSSSHQPQSVANLLDEYLRLARAQSPELAALQARQRSALELVAPSGALPDPMFGIMYQSMGPPWQPMAPMSMVQGEVSQVIPGVGKRQARRSAAQAEADARLADVAVAQARILADVRQIFAQIYAVDRQRLVLESANRAVEVLRAAVMGQIASGTAAQEAVARIEGERSRLREQLLDAQTSRVVLVVRLNRLLVRAENAVVPRLDGLPEIPAELPPVGDESFANSPALRAQRAAILAAVRRCESAEKETRPDFSVGLAGGATTSGEPIVTLRFGVGLPIWGATKQDPLIRAARSDVEAAQSGYKATELRIRAEVAELTARFRRDTQVLQLYRDAIVPTAELAFHAAHNAYSTGNADFATVIEDFRNWLEAQVGLSRRQAERLMTWSELRALIEPERGK